MNDFDLHFSVPDFDALFEETVAPLLINDLPFVTEEDKKNFNLVTMVSYDTDILSNTPHCSCGQTISGYNLGEICDVCHTEVVYPAEETIDLRVWMRAPDEVRGFISPYIWAQLSNLLSGKSTSLLIYLTNPKSRASPKQYNKANQIHIAYLNEIGWQRGMNYFIDNYDRFLDLIPILVKQAKTGDYQTKLNDYMALFRAYRHKTFPRYLPLATKSLMVLENTHLGSFADLSMAGAINAAKTIASISANTNMGVVNNLEVKISSVVSNLASYYESTIRNSIASRRGWLRGQWFCSKSHWTARGTIISLSDPHYYKELHLPWAQGLELLKVHIVAKLLQRGWPVLDAYNLVETSGNTYNPLLDAIMKELIAEGPDTGMSQGLKEQLPNVSTTGLPCIFQRNPSLTRLSAQLVYITKIKTDLTDKTISWSVLLLKWPNADNKYYIKLIISESYLMATLG